MAEIAQPMSAATSEVAHARRAGATVLALRIMGAGLAYLTQVLFARVMGIDEYGVFAAVWVWVGILTHTSLFGLGHTVCRFPPAYLARGEQALARGFLRGGALFVTASSLVMMLVWLGVIWWLRDWLNAASVWPLAIAAMALPFFALQDYTESTARSFNWPVLAFAPPYVARPLLIGIGMTGAVWWGLPGEAWVAMTVALVVTALTLVVQAAMLFMRLRRALPPGEREYRARQWTIASLPMAFGDGVTMLIGYADVLAVSFFLPPASVALYFAATRLIQFVNFVSYAASAATSQRFSAVHARGDHAALDRLVSRTALWTALGAGATALAVTAASPLLLALFGQDFRAAVPLVAILSAGLVLQAAMGPGEDLLNMLGQERACALASFAVAVLAVGLVCLLVPAWGTLGAAAAMACAWMVRGALLATIAWRRLGIWTPVRLR